MSSAYDIRPVTPPIQHAEGPLWCQKTNTLYFVDTFKATLHRLSLNEAADLESFTLEKRDSVGLFLPIKGKSNSFLVLADRMIQVLFWPKNEKLGATLDHELTIEKEKPKNQFNDGKVDCRGRVWAGTLTRNEDLSVADHGGALYMFNNKINDFHKKISNTSISNGMAWSSDNKKYYYIDSVTRYVVEYNFDEKSGRIFDDRIAFDLAHYPELKGIPDGMTIDENNNLWIALFGGHHIIQVNPKLGKIIRKIKMPVTYITSVTFGGPDCSILYATTSRLKLNDAQLEEEPLAGCVFAIIDLGVKGLPSNEVVL